MLYLVQSTLAESTKHQLYTPSIHMYGKNNCNNKNQAHQYCIIEKRQYTEEGYISVSPLERRKEEWK